MTYALVIELDAAALAQVSPALSVKNAYADIRLFLEENGYGHEYGSVHVGDESVDAVACVLMAQKLAETFDWFAPAMKTLRMLRISESCDLTRAVLPRAELGEYES